VSLTGEIINPPRDERGKWLPGHSANPGGFNRERSDLLKLFRDKAPDAANVLYDLMMDEAAAPAVRMACAVHWLDRTFGKPRQSVEVEQQGRTLEQLLTAIHEAREAEAQERGESKQAG
jgi:hypothetical protein